MPKRKREAGTKKRSKRRRLTRFEREWVSYRQQHRCSICNQLLPPGTQYDHVILLDAGGGNDLGNFQALCGSCHSNKTQIERQVRKPTFDNDMRVSKYFVAGPHFAPTPQRPPLSFHTMDLI